MSVEQQLKLAARRILADGQQHAPAAVGWALEQVLPLEKFSDDERTRMAKFTERELSLGASPWW